MAQYQPPHSHLPGPRCQPFATLPPYCLSLRGGRARSWLRRGSKSIACPPLGEPILTRRNQWTVFCDFDGTVSLTDVTDSLLEAFALPAWHAIEAKWRAGEIGSLACMRQQVELLRATPADLENHLRTVAIDPGFAAFAAHCAAHDLPLYVVSDGIDYAIRALLQRAGLGHLPVMANQLQPLGADRYTLHFPHAQPACRVAAGTCKCSLLQRHRGAGRAALLIGDGASDFCVAGEADWTLAKDRLLDHCRAQCLPHQAFTDFGEALAILRQLPTPEWTLTRV